MRNILSSLWRNTWGNRWKNSREFSEKPQEESLEESLKNCLENVNVKSKEELLQSLQEQFLEKFLKELNESCGRIPAKKMMELWGVPLGFLERIHGEFLERSQVYPFRKYLKYFIVKFLKKFSEGFTAFSGRVFVKKIINHFLLKCSWSNSLATPWRSFWRNSWVNPRTNY